MPCQLRPDSLVEVGKMPDHPTNAIGFSGAYGRIHVTKSLCPSSQRNLALFNYRTGECVIVLPIQIDRVLN
jgi:hypothetical protein